MVDFLSLSDEEFLKTQLSSEEALTESPSEDSTESSVQTGDSNNPVEEQDNDSSEAHEQTSASDTEDDDSQYSETTQNKQEPTSTEDVGESPDSSNKQEEDTNKETTSVNYESAYKKITSPFKANGTEISVTDPDDIIKLMQKGANYEKKMAQLKPNLRIVKTLEKHGLLDEAKLNNLIDLANKDTKAIAKLIKDSGVDPLDINTEEATNYNPTNHTISEREYNIDEAIENIKDSPNFIKTLDVISKEWDSASKGIISNDPNIIEIINAHMDNGVYDKVNSVIQQQKALGKLRGIPDVNAYYQIATQLANSGVLKVQGKEAVSSSIDSKRTEAVSTERLNKRKAAAPSPTAPAATKSPSEVNYLNLSDEDFLAMERRKS